MKRIIKKKYSTPVERVQDLLLRQYKLTKIWEFYFFLHRNTAVPSVEIERSEVNNVLQKETDDIGVPIKRANRKRTISKTFEESSSWD